MYLALWGVCYVTDSKKAAENRAVSPTKNENSDSQVVYPDEFGRVTLLQFVLNKHKVELSPRQHQRLTTNLSRARVISDTQGLYSVHQLQTLPASDVIIDVAAQAIDDAPFPVP